MKRILTYKIGSNSDGWTILRFLREKHFSNSVITQLKKTKNGICIDGQWEYANHILRPGEILTILLTEPEENIHLIPEKKCIGDFAAKEGHPDLIAPSFSVIYEDEDMLVVNKPAGMPIHPSMGHHEDTLAHAIMKYAAGRRESYPYRCINRLDRDTSGLTIIAKNAYSSCILYEQMRERQIKRIYYAIVEGLTKETGTINAPIGRKKDTVIERTVDFISGQPAITHFTTIAQNHELSFLKLCLETGRTHQIRVHMSYIGHPLIGDFLYHPQDTHMDRQALHAGELTCLHPISKKELYLKAPLPDDMLQVLQNMF